ncbi:MAG TPA: hypothetical protein VGO31_01685 [Microbacteriaceae bacterium]|jgi:hypothetical protein|nr:hypothetical protein [Microbacteriaceae bacterium]
MKRLVLLLSIVVACAAAAASTIGAAASQSATSLDLTSRVTSFRLAVGPKPANGKPTRPSAGDLGYVTGKLLKAGKPFGRYTGVCAQLNGGNQQCTFVLGLPDGQIITTAGYGPGMNIGNTAHEAIVGGTGAYEGAHGQGDDRETGNKGKLHLHLLR